VRKGYSLYWFGLILSATLLSGCGNSTPEPVAADPEAATGRTEKVATVANDYMVAAATEQATDAGTRVLAEGGSAIDAAIAVQAMLTLTEPQSSGIGGGAFILYWDNENKQLYTIDAREKAPAGVTADMFLDDNGKPIKWIEGVVGGRSVGVPGVLAGLELAHQRWGKRPWQSLFSDSIAAAEQGFVVSPRLEKLLQLEINPGLRQLQPAKDYFYPNGAPLQAGSLKKNPELAAAFSTIATQGAKAFYQGPLAQAMVDAVQNSAIAPGTLSMADLANYQALMRDPVCAPYRAFDVCGMAPPSSGGLTVLQMLGILAHKDLAAMPVNGAEAMHYFTQASKLAFADRNRYIADTDFVQVPMAAMLDPEYLAQRAALLGEQDLGIATPGEFGITRSASTSLEQPNTSHIAIVDAQGNAVSMTTSIEMGFGSTVMANGYLLNNQLTDFSFAPMQNERLIANRVEPGKRPRSSMAPTMVFDADGQLMHVVGSPGGTRIINYVAQTLVGLLDWQLDMQAAINLPKVTNLNGRTALEKGTAAATLKGDLEARGHQVDVRDLNSGIHGITIMKDGRLIGGADPRREGRAKGQ